MIYEFGKQSKSNLATTDEILVRICYRALGYRVMDIAVIEGHRNLIRQKKMFDAKKSHIDGITRKGMHNYTPSLAVDLLPCPNTINGIVVWEDTRRFSVLAGLMYAAAYEEGEEIIWGGDWDGDGNNQDSTLDDLPHFQRVVQLSSGIYH